MLSAYYQQQNGKVSFTREQGSGFAKTLADDFNPLHDVDAKRFCVPGDLLFSLVLDKYGVSEKMSFSFLGMVTDAVELQMPAAAKALEVSDGDKAYLAVNRSGQSSQNPQLIENLIRSYVAFSGTAFPHVIVPLMAEQDAMISPKRPMVMYQSMAIELDRLDICAPTLAPSKPSFNYEGKRGSITLRFNLIENDEIVGRGEKHMLVSGIQSYIEEAMDGLISAYNDSKI
jgi:hypothetical protein